jgi:GTP cyclohydrolase I
MRAEEAASAMSVTVHRLRPKARLCNQAVEDALLQADRSPMRDAVARKIEEIFEIVYIDYANDHNTRETPQRVARVIVDEMMRGRFEPPPEITEFDNALGFDQLMVTGPIDLRSTCAHHLLPIYGYAYIGVLPSASGKIIGLSKYDRIVDHFSARPQIQEELVKQIGQHIVDMTKPRGLAVRISAVHMCKTHRGVRASHRSRMVNSAYYGELALDPHLKAQFLQECAGLEAGSAC